MARIPFKRHLIILAVCLLLIGIAIPIATHASGPSNGEQKRAHTAYVQSVAGQPTSITADCTSPQLLTTLNTGDKFTASATLTSSDSGEQAEGEFLQILDAATTPPTTLLTVDYNTGKGTVSFTASTNGDAIQACIIGSDSDETGNVTFNVTSAPTPVPTPSPVKAVKLPMIPHSISKDQLVRLVGLVLLVGSPVRVPTSCSDLLSSKGSGAGGVFYNCLSDLNDIIELANDGKLPLPFSQFFIFNFQVLQIECQAGVQDACQKLYGGGTA